jgi:hypothetical protein
MSYNGQWARTAVPQWTTALDFDWTAQGSGTISSDGNTTIGGVVWKKSNSANDNTAMAYSASGLVIIPRNTSDYGTSRTLPLLWCKLTNIIPTLEASYGIRIWAYWSADNVTANYDSSNIALDSDGTTGFALARGRHAGGAAGLGDHMLNAGSNVLGFQNTNLTLDATNRVVCLEVPHMGYPVYKGYYGAWSSGWPAFSSLTGLPAGQSSRVLNLQASTVGATFGAQRAGSVTAFSTTLTRCRIDFLAR